LQADRIRCRIGKVGNSFIRLIFKMAINIVHKNVGDSKIVVLPLQMSYSNKYFHIIFKYLYISASLKNCLRATKRSKYIFAHHSVVQMYLQNPSRSFPDIWRKEKRICNTLILHEKCKDFFPAVTIGKYGLPMVTTGYHSTNGGQNPFTVSEATNNAFGKQWYKHHLYHW
jgi:hypothetical protein